MTAGSDAGHEIPADARSLPEAFRHVAERHPGRVAVTDRSGTLTYAELDAVSDRLAAGLARRGLRQGQYVGIVIDRSVRTPVAILGLLKAGCAYVPLDPVYPEERLRLVARDTALRVVVGEAAQARKCGLADLEVVTVDEEAAAAPPSEQVTAAHAAYVIHTSGSTGAPKGCVVTHGNVLALMRHTLPLFDVGPADRWTLFHSFGFDFSVWELWGALLTGATAVCVSDVEVGSPEDLLKLLVRERVTVLSQVPSVFRVLNRAHAELGSPRLSLRYVVFGGESVDLDVVSDYLSRTPAAKPVMMNMYGITETTVFATFQALGERELDGGVRSPIGRPLPHVTLRLLDEGGREVPAGTAGEIYIGGDSVAVGYLNRPELTAERFVTLDAGEGPQRFYRTGDLARRTADDGLEYLGRNDQQVKINGFRVELDEIAGTLREHDIVRDAAVVADRGENGMQLVAYVVTDHELSTRNLVLELRRHALRTLPRHMVPRKYEVVAELPLTPSGKLDRRALASLPRKRRPG